MKLSVQKVGDFFRQSDADDAGAIALLCLAAVLALMMMAWIIVDATDTVEDKVMLQGAADTAAFSHAAVEARSMNMISYANIAKRSIMGAHSLYPAMFASYTVWVVGQLVTCVASWGAKFDACLKGVANIPLWVLEASQDHVAYSGNPFTPYLNAAISLARQMVKRLEKYVKKYNKVAKVVPGLPKIDLDLPDAGGYGNSQEAHLPDMEALHNYQRYMMHITPWWAWSEQLSRGWRNGATTVANFPPPPGDIANLRNSVQTVLNKVEAFLAKFGLPSLNPPTVGHGYGGLPIAHESYDTLNWICHMLVGPPDCNLGADFFDFETWKTSGNVDYIAEHILNVAIFTKESDIPLATGGDKAIIFGGGATLFFATVGLLYSDSIFRDKSGPFKVDAGSGGEAEWLRRTSNLVFAYLNKPDRMKGDKSKFNVISKSYSQNTDVPAAISDQMYQSSGQWTMARSEITFNGDGWKPDLWHPSWTARMRPVHLPGEFDEAGYNMFDAYTYAAPYLALSAQIGSLQGGAIDAITSSLRDLAVMGAASAAMGPSTAGGINK